MEENELHTFPKIAYLIRCLIKKVQDSPPAPTLVTRVELEIGRLLRLNLPSDAVVHVKDLLDVLRGVKKTLSRAFGEPLYAITQKKRTAVFETLRAKGSLISCGYQAVQHHLLNDDAQEHVLSQGNISVNFVSL